LVSKQPTYTPETIHNHVSWNGNTYTAAEVVNFLKKHPPLTYCIISTKDDFSYKSTPQREENYLLVYVREKDSCPITAMFYFDRTKGEWNYDNLQEHWTNNLDQLLFSLMECSLDSRSTPAPHKIQI
jgi:hypothetical protein